MEQFESKFAEVSKHLKEIKTVAKTAAPETLRQLADRVEVMRQEITAMADLLP